MPVQIRTGRLILTPVTGSDLPDLMALKADPLAFAMMLGGVRAPWQVIDEMAGEICYWGSHRVGMFAVREDGIFQGVVGVHDRPDGRGHALRFAVWHEARGRGVAREAAGAVLRDAHMRGGLKRVIAVVRADNFGSRMVVGAIGMHESDVFLRDGNIMLVYESLE